jgi:hypothetical protein
MSQFRTRSRLYCAAPAHGRALRGPGARSSAARPRAAPGPILRTRRNARAPRLRTGAHSERRVPNGGGPGRAFGRGLRRSQRGPGGRRSRASAGAEERAKSRPTEGCRWAWSGATGEGSVPMGAGAGVVGAAAGAKTLEELKRNDRTRSRLCWVLSPRRSYM